MSEVTVSFGRTIRPDNHAYEYEKVELGLHFKLTEYDLSDADGNPLGFDVIKAELDATISELEAKVNERLQRYEVNLLQRELGGQVVSQSPSPAAVAPPLAPAAPPSPAVPPPPAPVPAPAAPPLLPPPPAPPAPPAAPAAPEAVGAVQLVAGFDRKDYIASLVAHYRQHPDQWYDNRTNKKNQKAPDFRIKDKSLVGADGYTYALWVSDFS